MNWKECRDKEERMQCLGESQDNIVSFIMFGSKKNKHYEDNRSRLYKIMSEEKFMKTCKKMCKKSALVDLSPSFTTVILDFLENNKELDAEFDKNWANHVIQMQIPLFHPKTKGAWIDRFDDAIATALEQGPLRDNAKPLPDEIKAKIEAVELSKNYAMAIKRKFVRLWSF